MRNIVVGLIAFCSLFLPNQVFSAQSAPTQITKIRTGWGSDTFAIETNQQILNPAGCSSPDGYISTAADAGYKTHYAAALLAFALVKQVTIVVSDTECLASRPKILGIYVTQ